MGSGNFRLYEVAKLSKLSNLVQKKIRPLWTTIFTVGKEVSFTIQLRRGIFYLSSLLFCLAIIPLSTMLNHTEGFPSQYLETPITHLFFMDDSKVYSSGPEQLEMELNLVQHSRDGPRPTKMCHITKGKLVQYGH